MFTKVPFGLEMVSNLKGFRSEGVEGASVGGGKEREYQGLHVLHVPCTFGWSVI